MATTALAPNAGGELDRPATGPGRELGQKRKAQLRLALGYRDEQRRGAPVKTDYFIPHGGDMAVQKFTSVYGDQPRAIDIRLPSSLGGFLDIRHVAFAGGQNDGGGILKAIGSVNFALEGTLGGPDRLTVFNIVDTGKEDRGGNAIKELATEEILIDDVNDPAAAELGVYLQATASFGIPDVLGFGGVCEIRSRGKETIDTLWKTAVDIYGQLGQQASMILRPKLVLKESSMLTPRGQKAKVYVVDLYVPESMDEVIGRMRELRELMPAGPAAALYGQPQARPSFGELPSGADHDVDEVALEQPGHNQQAAVEASPPPEVASAAAPGSDFDTADDEDAAIAAAADAASGYVANLRNKNSWAHGLTLAQIHERNDDDAAVFFEWALAQKKPEAQLEAVRAYTREHFPALYDAAVTAGEQS